MKYALTIFTILALSVGAKAGMGVGSSTKIEPVSADGATISFNMKHFSGGPPPEFVGSLVSTSNGKVNWETVLFRGDYSGLLSTALQEVNLKSLDVQGGVLIAVDDRGQVYKLNAKSGKLISPPESRNYSAKNKSSPSDK